MDAITGFGLLRNEVFIELIIINVTIFVENTNRWQLNQTIMIREL